MHTSALLRCLPLFLLCSCAAAPRTRLSLRDFNTRYEIIGRLGLPLGTVTPIRAEIVRGDELDWKGYADVYLLRVRRVGALDLPKPVILEFYSRTYEVPHDRFDRYKDLHGDRAKSLSSRDRPELDRDYVGKTFDLRVFERGAYEGMPDVLLPFFTSRGWGFGTSLEVLDVLHPQQ